MSNDGKETITAGSDRVPRPGSDGTAGALPEGLKDEQGLAGMVDAGDAGAEILPAVSAAEHVPAGTGKGPAGTPPDASKTGQTPDKTKGVLPENEEPERARRNASKGKSSSGPANKVFRKTELHGEVHSSGTKTRRKTRRRTLKNLSESEREELFREFEAAFRVYIDLLIENQKRFEENLLLQIVDLDRQIEDLEYRMNHPRYSESGTMEAGL